MNITQRLVDYDERTWTPSYGFKNGAPRRIDRRRIVPHRLLESSDVVPSIHPASPVGDAPTCLKSALPIHSTASATQTVALRIKHQSTCADRISELLAAVPESDEKSRADKSAVPMRA